MSEILHSFRRRRSAARHGYSLVEMLVVAAIIGLLIGLVLMVSLKVIGTTRNAVRYVSQQAMDIAALSDTPLQVAAPVPPSSRPGSDQFIPDQYLIEFALSANPQNEADKLLAAFGGGRIIHIYDTPESKGCNAYIKGTTLAALQAHPSVRAAEQDQRAHLCADTFPTGIRRIGTTSNINRKLPLFSPTLVGLNNVNGLLVRGAKGRVVVAVADTGVDATHPDLNVTFAKPFGPFAPITDDVQGHGTHVAGTIGAKINGSGVVGMFPNVEIWNIRVLDDTGSGAFGDIIAGINFVRSAANVVRVLNMSLGGGFSNALNTACNNCSDAGVIVCVAAGNDSDDARFYSPASASRVVCVAALADSDGKFGGLGSNTSAGPDDTFADFSNYGQTVDVIAPGTDILSTQPGNAFGVKSGTSMATPHIAGLFALYSESYVVAQNGQRRPARGLELASLFVQRGAAELIRGPSGNFGSRNYPLLLDKLSKKP